MRLITRRHRGGDDLEQRRALVEASERWKGLLFWIAMTALLCCFAPSSLEAQAPAQEETPQAGGNGARVVETRKAQNQDEGANLSAQQKKLATDKARLLRLSIELKIEVNKAGTGTLSVTAIRKANEIESLARVIKQEMNRDLKKAQ